MTLRYRLFGIPGTLEEFIEKVKYKNEAIKILANVSYVPSDDIPGWFGVVSLSCGKEAYIAYNNPGPSEGESWTMVNDATEGLIKKIENSGLVVKLNSEPVLQN